MPSPNPMACPIDGTVLTMSERQGIEIDYCPTCRGVWLDRGELDKIIERSGSAAPAPQAPAAPPAPPPPMQQPQQQSAPWGQPTYQQPGYGHDPRYHGKRKKSFLEDLFD